MFYDLKDKKPKHLGENWVAPNAVIIGAKSLVTERKEIPDNSLVMGSPGKIIRQLTEDEIQAIKQNAIRYQENWKKYSKSIF